MSIAAMFVYGSTHFKINIYLFSSRLSTYSKIVPYFISFFIQLVQTLDTRFIFHRIIWMLLQSHHSENENIHYLTILSRKCTNPIIENTNRRKWMKRNFVNKQPSIVSQTFQTRYSRCLNTDLVLLAHSRKYNSPLCCRIQECPFF